MPQQPVKVCFLLTLINTLSGEDVFEEDLSDKPNPRWRKRGFKMDMMMMMIHSRVDPSTFFHLIFQMIIPLCVGRCLKFVLFE